jgi:four helix bundle protein
MPESFDRLDAYSCAIRLVGQALPLVLRLRRQECDMADQLHRAVLSVACNTAEGAGEFSAGDKARLYRYALRSAAEATAILDAANEIGLAPAADHKTCRDTSVRLVAMLTRLVLVTSARAERRPPNPKKAPR